MNTKKTHQRWGYLLLVASLSAICVATIFPFKFAIPQGFSGQFIIKEFNFGSNVKDYLQNILLFIPLGISLAFILDRPQRNTAIVLIVAGLCGAVVSTTIEITQFFLPIRVSNLTDIIYNSLGATLGGILYCWRSDIIQLAIGIITGDRRKLSLKSLLVAILSYCSIVILGVWVLLINVNLSNWNEDFPLVIGNEATGDRPWNGYINNLYICDRSLGTFEIEKAFEQADTFFPQLSSLVTGFNFVNSQNYYLDNSRHVAKLLWQSPASLPTNNQDITSNLSKHQESANNLIPKKSGVLVNSKQWLKTAQPVTFLTQKFKKTDELSLFMTISTNNINQVGPARIVALSDGIYTQNLVIDNFHQILITFANNKLNFYVDNFERKYSFKFTPAITFVVYFPWQKQNWRINLDEFEIIRYEQLFYTMIFVPFILLVSVLVYYLAANKSVFK